MFNLFTAVREAVEAARVSTAIGETATKYVILHLIEQAAAKEKDRIKPEVVAYWRRYGKSPIEGMAISERAGSKRTDSKKLEAFLAEHGRTMADFQTTGKPSVVINIKAPSERALVDWYALALGVNE